MVKVREYELMTEAHAKLSVVRNCSNSSLYVCLGEGKQLVGRGWSAVAGGGGRRREGRQYTVKENLEQFPIGCPAKLVSFRYNRNRNRKKFRNYPKQKDLFRFFQKIPKLERFGSFGCFGSTKKEPKEPNGGEGREKGEGKWTRNGKGNGREMEEK
jgi:hypothetical protein